MGLTERQSEGVKAIQKWYKNQSKQVFTLAGYAGTGKTYMTSYIIQEMGFRKDEVAYCTFTGKASLVLMRYHEGNSNVFTIHKLIYDMFEDDEGEPYFKLKKELKGVRLILVDEFSMVDEDILNDLKSFGISILGVGDHGQLPAIGKQTNLLQNADFTLNEILRQAEGNPIIYLSMLIREGKDIPMGKLGDNVMVLRKHDKNVNEKTMLRADQVICGYNRTRHQINRKMRNALGFVGDDPQRGDKVILTKNNWSRQVEGFNYVNGMIGFVENDPRLKRMAHVGMDVWEMDVRPDFLTNTFDDVLVPERDFYGKAEELSPWQRKLVDRMDFGYAITCHKSQGSQWENVLVWNEPFGDEPWRHPYTAVTRAEKNLIFAI